MHIRPPGRMSRPDPVWVALKPPYRRTPGDRYTNLVQRRRDELCFGVWALGMAVAWVRGAEIADLARLSPAAPAVLVWVLVLAGVGFRLWAAGNMRKNSFTRPAGPYVLVRHPLYLGTLLISLGFFLALGMPVAGLVLWGGLLAAVFYPVLRKEERELKTWFPRPYGRYVATVPALVPNPAALGRAISSSRFSFELARVNYGWRALVFLVLVPGLTGILRWLIG